MLAYIASSLLLPLPVSCGAFVFTPAQELARNTSIDHAEALEGQLAGQQLGLVSFSNQQPRPMVEFSVSPLPIVLIWRGSLRRPCLCAVAGDILQGCLYLTLADWRKRQ